MADFGLRREGLSIDESQQAAGTEQGIKSGQFGMGENGLSAKPWIGKENNWIQIRTNIGL